MTYEAELDATTGDMTSLAQWAAQQGAAATRGETFHPDNHGMLEAVVPPGYEHRLIDLERYQAAPRRATGTVTVRDAGSFARYVNRFGAPKSAAMFANAASRTITCILNYHEKEGGPGWGDHRVVMELRETPRWQQWKDFASKRHKQETFAWFLEQRAGDIADPDAADIYTMARDLKVTKNVTYEKAVNEQNGNVRLLYNEEVSGANRTSKMEVPERMTVRVTPFEGDDPLDVEGWLRYRVEDGTCWFAWEMGAEVMEELEQRFEGVVDHLAETLGVDLFLGPAPAEMPKVGTQV